MQHPLLYLLFTFSTLSVFGQFAEKDAYKIGVQGVQKIDAQEYEEGIKLLKKARNIAPKEYDYSFEIGKAYLKSGDPKKAEKYLFDLQYHVNLQPDLYLLLATCYKELEALKKTPDTDSKKELETLRYGVEKFPEAGILYLELGQFHLEKKRIENALAVWEKGIYNAPHFAENYFWAAKLLKASGNNLWAWFYAEVCFNMTDDKELERSSAIIVHESTSQIFNENWAADPNKLDQELKFVLTHNCAQQVEKRECLLKNWDYQKFTVAPLFDRMQQLEKRGWLEAFSASIVRQTEPEMFLSWLASNKKTAEEYATWRYWNPLKLKKPIDRFAE